jgi:hypothetical protein
MESENLSDVKEHNALGTICNIRRRPSTAADKYLVADLAGVVSNERPRKTRAVKEKVESEDSSDDEEPLNDRCSSKPHSSFVDNTDTA